MNLLKNIILLIAVIILSSSSCSDKDKDPVSYCGTENPLENIPWLKEIKTTLQMRDMAAGGQIIRYKYKGNDVFWIDMCYGCSDDLISVRDCQGNVICEFGGIAGLNTCPDFQAEATDRTMLFDGVQH